MKTADGYVVNNETGKKVDVVFKGLPMKPIDLAIGCGAITFGILHLIVKAFRSGFYGFEKCYFDALEEAGCVEKVNVEVDEESES